MEERKRKIERTRIKEKKIGEINTAISIGSTTYISIIAPPVIIKSTVFIATSIDIIEISDMPIAVVNADLNGICRLNMKVSRAIDVIKPFKIASDKIAIGFQNI